MIRWFRTYHIHPSAFNTNNVKAIIIIVDIHFNIIGADAKSWIDFLISVLDYNQYLLA